MSADKPATRVKQQVVRLEAGASAQAFLPANPRRTRVDVQVTGGVPILMRFDTKVLQDGGDFVLPVGALFQFHDPAPAGEVSFFNPDAAIAATVAVLEGTSEPTR